MARRSGASRPAHSAALGRHQNVQADDRTRANTQTSAVSRHQRDEGLSQSPERSSDTRPQASLGYDHPRPNPTVGDAQSPAVITLAGTRTPPVHHTPQKEQDEEPESETEATVATPRTANSTLAGTPTPPVHHTPQKEQDEEPESKPEATPRTANSTLAGTRTPPVHHAPQEKQDQASESETEATSSEPISSPRSQSATSDRSSPLRNTGMVTLATTNSNGSASAGGRLLDRVVTRAIHKVSKAYHGGRRLPPIAMQLVKNALRMRGGLTRASVGKISHILRSLIPMILATIRDVLTAEKTPEGSDHASIPGAYPIMAEGPEVAAGATSVDQVASEPASLGAQPCDARLAVRPSLPEGASLHAQPRESRLALRPTPSKETTEGPILAEPRASKESSYPTTFSRRSKRRSKRPSYSVNPLYPHFSSDVAAALARSKYQDAGTPASDSDPDLKRKVEAYLTHMPEHEIRLAKAYGLSLTEVAEFQYSQLSWLGPYWTRCLSPFVGGDGKELPMAKLTPEQIGMCRALVQQVDPRYYVKAAVILVRDDGQLLVAMRIEVEWSPSSDDRGLIEAGSSTNGLTWDYVVATDERGGPTRVLHPAVLHNDSVHLMGESGEPMEIDDCSISFLLHGDSAADVTMVDAMD